MRPINVVVATDGSDGANKALRWVSTHFAPEELQVILITVVPDVRQHLDPTGYAYPVDATEPDVSEILERAETDYLSGFSVRTLIRRGDPATQIIQVADDIKADLVVVGHRGLRGLEGMLMGSVARALMQRSPVPVLVVPKGAAKLARSRDRSRIV